jgi:branched-chain amino acid transport system substrate-binding protein
MKLGWRMPAAALALVMLAGCRGGANGGGEIVIGLAVPLNRPGGIAVRRAAELAVQEINDAGGIDGRKLMLEIKDDGGNPEQAITVAQELRDDPRVVAVVGHVNSSTTLKASSVYNDPRGGVAAVSPTASSPELTQAGPWTFRVSPSDLAYGPALAEFGRARGYRRAAILYANDEYGRGVSRSFASAFVRQGGQVVGTDPYDAETVAGTGSPEPYLRRALGRGMDALFIAGTADDAQAILPVVRRLGYTGPVLGADGLLGVEAAEGIAEGTYIGAAFFADARQEAAARFVAAFQEKYQLGANADAALGYDAVQVIAAALRQAGPNRARVREYLEGIGTRNPPVEGVTGTIRFDSAGDVPDKMVAVGVVRGGTVVSVPR